MQRGRFIANTHSEGGRMVIGEFSFVVSPHADKSRVAEELTALKKMLQACGIDFSVSLRVVDETVMLRPALSEHGENTQK